MLTLLTPSLLHEIEGEMTDNHPVILVADDDETIRRIITLLLTREGYSVITARDGKEALELSRQCSGKIEVLISDIEMPHLDGVELCACLLHERPETKAMLITGANAEKARYSTLPVLLKPFSMETLIAKVREVLAAS